MINEPPRVWRKTKCLIALFFSLLLCNQSDILLAQSKGVVIRDTIFVRPRIFTPKIILEGWFIKPYLNGRLFVDGGDTLSVDTVDYAQSIPLKVDLQYGTYHDVWGSAVTGGSSAPLNANGSMSSATSGGIFVTVLTSGPDFKSVPVRDRTLLDTYRGVFVRANGDTIKPTDGSLQIEVSAGEEFYYVANGTPPEGATANVQIDICYPEAITGCGSFVATVVVKKKEDEHDHFEVTFEKDTVAFTESSKIYVQAKNVNNQNIELANDKLVKLSIITNGDYGTFIDKNNDTLFTVPIVLEHVPYGDIKAGLIQFSTVKKNPMDPLLCKVKVELESEPTKTGEGAIPVAEQTLKIVMEGEHVVELMNLRGFSKPQKPKTANKKEFTIQLIRNKAWVKNYSFLLMNDNLDSSGGHDHTNDRPTDTQAQRRDNYGYYILKRANDTIDVRPYEGQTKDDGIEKFDYVASVFGDKMMLRVETVEANKKKFLWDTLSLMEKVDGLVRLDDGTTYDLIGGTAEHHGPPIYTDNHNHYSTATVRTNIQNIASEYHRQFPDKVVLQINDMSLSYGGGFDVRGHWERDIVPGGAHQTHRDGRSLDLRIDRGAGGIPVLRDVNGRLVRDPVSGVPRGNQTFERISRERGARPAIHSPDSNNEHYHLDF